MFVAGFWEVFDGELASGCGRLNCKLAKTTQENNVEYLAWFMENILGSWLRGITVWKTCM